MYTDDQTTRLKEEDSRLCTHTLRKCLDHKTQVTELLLAEKTITAVYL